MAPTHFLTEEPKKFYESKLFWSKFAHMVRHLQDLCDYIDSNHLPLGLSSVYIDLISAHLEMIKDLFFISYGLILNTNSESDNIFDNYNSNNHFAFAFNC